MNANQPTPTPWKARLSHNGHDHTITGPDNVALAKVYARPHETGGAEPAYGTVGAAEGRANAAAIVQAINTHDTMLRALLVALSHLMPVLPPGMLPVRTQAEACNMVAAAIQAATGEL